MSEKKLQDYLPFYIGCKCMTPDGIGTLVGLPWHILIQDRATIHFGKKMIKTVNSIDGGYNKVRNHGDYALFAKRYEPIGSEGITEDGFDMPGGVKPILRRLDDITDEELNEMIILLSIYDLSKCEFEYDQYWVNAIKDGRVIDSLCIEMNGQVDLMDSSPATNPQSEAFNFLLKKGFDLFSLLDMGLAIDSATLPKIN